MQDIEFTVENGRLYMLQCRNGKRTAKASVKIAVDMVSEAAGTFPDGHTSPGGSLPAHMLLWGFPALLPSLPLVAAAGVCMALFFCGRPSVPLLLFL